MRGAGQESWTPLQQAAQWLSTVPARAANLVSQFAVGPRRVACGIPLLHQHECIVVTEQEAANEPALRPECGGVAVLTRNGGREGRQVPPCPLDDVC